MNATKESLCDTCPLCGGHLAVRPTDRAGEQLCPSCGERVWLLRRSVGDVIVLTFLPGVKAGFDDDMQIRAAIQASRGAGRLVLNLSRLKFVSSLFLANLMTLYRRMSASQGKLKLCGLRPEAREVLHVTRLDTLFGIHDDESGAVSSF
jgi:anti-sigma B factor antagonist